MPTIIDKYRRLASCLGSGLVLACLVFTWGREAGGFGRYFDGDWLGYTCLRFVTSIAVDPEYVNFGTRGGILRFDRFREQWESTLTTLDGLPSNRILALAYDPEYSQLYAQTTAGAVAYNPASEEFELTATFPDSLVTRWKNIDLLDYNLPFEYSTTEEDFITDQQLRDFQVRGAVVDDWGNTWIGTWGLGIWRGYVFDNTLERLTQGLAHRNVLAMERLEGNWWFAGPPLEGDPAGITVFDTLRNTWQYYEAHYAFGLDSDNILDLATTGDTLWMATTAGLSRYCAEEKHEFRTYNEFSGLLSNLVTAVAPDEDVLWIGTDLGPAIMYLAQDSLARATDFQTNGAYVYDLAVIDDFVWLGTDRGLFRLYKGSNQWRKFSAAQGILNGRVRAIAADDTAFYFATDRGLALVWRDGSGVEEYLAGEISYDGDLYALAVTERIVWVATPLGLVRFDPRTEETRLFDQADGLFDEFVQVIYPDGDYLWLGTREGVQRFLWKNPYRID